MGVVIQEDLSPEKHINNIFGNAYRMLRNLRTAFNYMDKNMMRIILTTMIKPKLEYAMVVWCYGLTQHEYMALSVPVHYKAPHLQDACAPCLTVWL